MIIITKGTRIIDIVKSIENIENGLKVVRLNDDEIVYATGETYTLTEIDSIPNDLNINELNTYAFLNGEIIIPRKELYSKFDFRQLFTFQERVKIDNYEKSIDNQNVSDEIKNTRKAVMKTITTDLSLANAINVKHESIASYVAYFVECDLISQERLNKILGL